MTTAAFKNVRQVMPRQRKHWVGNGFNVYPVFAHLAFSESLSPWLSAPFDASGFITGEEARFNKDMASVRIAVEWGFGKIKTNFAYLDRPKRWT